MTATVRLDDTLSEKLNTLSKTLHKKKSDIIREAINLYLEKAEGGQKEKLMRAIAKTKDKDKNEYMAIDGTLGDGL